MIVLDASALIELLLGTELGRSIAERIASPWLTINAPHLVDVETTQALRRLVRLGDIDVGAAEGALARLHDLDLEGYPHEPLLDRIWRLRDHLSAYDAAYVALAEALDAPLLTCDAKLARTPAAARRVELVK